MKIGLVEFYDPSLHGRTNRSSPDIDGNYIVIYAFNPVEFAEDPSSALQSLASLTQHRLRTGERTTLRPSLELVSVARLQGGEDVATMLTSRIVSLQRLWRRR